jgi:hypothetical protein
MMTRIKKANSLKRELAVAHMLVLDALTFQVA